jgi:hypothetical protein
MTGECSNYNMTILIINNVTYASRQLALLTGTSVLRYGSCDGDGVPRNRHIG